MSYERQSREWSWVIKNRSEVQPVIVAAEANRGIVGFTSFGLSRVTDRPPGGPYAGDGEAHVGEIYTLYVRPEYQDRGIGRRLLASAFANRLRGRWSQPRRYPAGAPPQPPTAGRGKRRGS